MENQTALQSQPLEIPTVRKVKASAPLHWLKLGWQDFRSNPLASGFYGLAFVIAGAGVTAASWHNTVLVMSFVTGFFLVAPFLCLGLYDLSRQRESTQSSRLWPSMTVFLTRRRDTALLVVFQAVIMIAWIRLAALMSALYVTNTGTSITILFNELTTSSDGLGFLGMFMLVGAALAALLFVTSVVAWPMLLDRKSGVLIAIITSFKAVMQNKGTMFIWAGLIVALVTLGLMTFTLGLLVIIPVIGHATWHAYRQLVE